MHAKGEIEGQCGLHEIEDYGVKRGWPQRWKMYEMELSLPSYSFPPLLSRGTLIVNGVVFAEMRAFSLLTRTSRR